MAIKLASDAAAAWAAVILSGAVSVITTASHYGSTNTQIKVLASKQTETDARIAKHDDQLAEIKAAQAANAQALADIKDAVHDIQQQVHQRDHH